MNGPERTKDVTLGPVADVETRDSHDAHPARLIRQIQMADDEDDACLQAVLGLERLGYPGMLSFLQTVDGARVILADPKLAAGGKWSRIADVTERSYDEPTDLLPRVLHRREPRFILDSRSDPLGENDEQLCRHIGLVSQYVIPLVTPSLEIGTLQLDLGERTADPRPEELVLLDAIGAVTSLAIERSRLTRQAEVLEGQIVQERDLIAFASVSAAALHGMNHDLRRYGLELESTLANETVRSNKEALRFLRRTQSSVNNWLSRLDECIVQGSKDFRPRVMPVRPLVDAIVKRVWEQWRKRGITTDVVDDAPQVAVRAREQALSEILTSLLINSVQAKARSIIVLIRWPGEMSSASRESGSQRQVEIVVRDDGQGVPEAFRGQIGKFGWTSKAKDGTGIGLTVAHLLAKEMGGNIALISGGKSAGQTFTEFAIRIPIAEP